MDDIRAPRAEKLNASFELSVRKHISETLRRHNASLSVVATRLDSSPRTVQRRLAELGLKYAFLCDDVRRERAMQLVAEGRMPMAAIAAELGYRDAGSFTRAFRRWTGDAPNRYRKK